MPEVLEESKIPTNTLAVFTGEYKLTLKRPITLAANDILKYIFFNKA